ncbi:GIY-YIG nuclease family protein [Acetobacter lambici]|uniref:GIY-YIG nuclease family protein n=1 Tax=Acetobacter lambici TaxID=1332824 RepID=A0ABT1F3Z8_9PROT|nr:GIY-YIG nuclease family protein [Acetobacter lambici]MCP1243838.1 GIY-YIG nuclease family protein [Acetobacter lambici]MCP1259946.1 GIY-YIG nuclease family protein [Acetobacter lambici]
METIQQYHDDDVVYVYLLTNDIDGKQYVGISYQPLVRWSRHNKADTYIGRAFRKYGQENFTKDVIAVSCRKGALQLEGHFCEVLNCLHPHGYNMIAGGFGSCVASARPHEVRLKISKAKKGVPSPLRGRKGKSPSVSTRNAISKSLTGFKRGPSPLKGKMRDKPSPLKGRPGRIRTKEEIESSATKIRGKPWSQARRDAHNKKKAFQAEKK